MQPVVSRVSLVPCAHHASLRTSSLYSQSDASHARASVSGDQRVPDSISDRVLRRVTRSSVTPVQNVTLVRLSCRITAGQPETAPRSRRLKLAMVGPHGMFRVRVATPEESENLRCLLTRSLEDEACHERSGSQLTLK